ncbi:Cell surface protein [Archangium gephyra]|uniref:Cell surface protein n=1 Tax=Archangium gephyra TaxID=48 RepID=A0AAC8Q4W3_9BACT|nr:Cell surface protein [Archangium gephyra]
MFLPGIAPAPEGAAGHFELRHPGASALFTGTGLALRLSTGDQRARELGWQVAGGRATRPRAEKPREAKLHRLLGARDAWEPGLPTYAGLRYSGVLPGVDLWFEERAEGLEYGFRAERGADLRRVKLEYTGALAVRVVEQGRALEVELPEGVLRERGLRCSQEAEDGASWEVECRFAEARRVGTGRWEYAIEVSVERPELPVVVDPVILWNSYLGGLGTLNGIWDIEQNGAGELFIAGSIGVSPSTPPRSESTVFGSGGGGADVVVAKYQRDGTLAWSVLLGGNGIELGRALALGAAGEVYVAGTTTSLSVQWERPSGTQSSISLGSADGFVARIAASGSELEWFQRIGGNGDDLIQNMLRTANGQLYVIGDTTSNNIPDLKGTPKTILGSEAFLTRIDPSAPTPKVLWTVLFQGMGNESLYDLLDEDGFMYVTGSTSSFSADGSLDALVAVVRGIDSEPELVQELHLGGSGNEEGRAVRFSGPAAQREVRVFGTTRSDNFGGGARGGADIFVATYPTWSLDPTMRQKALKLLGSDGEDILICVSADASGQVYLGGTTSAVRSFPMTGGGFDSTYSGGEVDGFVARVGLEGEPAIQWASYVGGEGRDEVYALRVDALDPTRLLLGGSTTSKDLPYSGDGYSPSPNPNAFNAMFLLSVDLDASPEPDGGTMGPFSPLGWSCGSTAPRGAPGAWGLVTLVGLGLLGSRRRKRLAPRV